MAINREIREDLMRDATAYARRLLIRKTQTGESIFVGFRKPGGWSVYFGEDPVYQFNPQNKLRRVHFEDQNYAASDGKLYLLHRTRVGGRVEIQKIYSVHTEQRLLADCLKRVRELAELILTSGVTFVDCLPADDQELVADLAESIRITSTDLQIANAANA
jgi:hypothetical protein